jgi:hypothetical protein
MARISNWTTCCWARKAGQAHQPIGTLPFCLSGAIGFWGGRLKFKWLNESFARLLRPNQALPPRYGLDPYRIQTPSHVFCDPHWMNEATAQYSTVTVLYYTALYCTVL